MSETQEHAYTLASLFFFEKELFSDEIMRPKQLHLPPPRTHVNSILSREGELLSVTNSASEGRGTT